MLREVPYGWGGGHESPESGRAVYVLENGQCIFSGIVRGGTSTINGAEGIIKAIVDLEGIDPSEIKFFDLRTSWGYKHLQVSQFELTELTLVYEGGEPKVTAWKRVESSPDMLRLFLPYITSDSSSN
ncbi:MAG: hypothetical protein WC654_02685 [Patescibacteria group bacterium]